MNEKLGEALSALMDGEADDQALDQILDMVQDPALRDAWRRFHTASDGLQSAPLVTGIDLSGPIMAALEQEPAYSDAPADAGSLNESLSALMDDEADERALDQVLENVHDIDVRNTWRRYNTARHGLEPGPLVTDTDLSGRIMAAIEQASAESADHDQALFESLSALMDGEADEQALEQVLDSLHDNELRDSWRRYHLTRHSLQQAPLVAGTDLSSRIMAAIEEEPAYSSQPLPSEIPETPAAIEPVGRWQRMLRPVASFAVAASVFAVVLVGSQFYNNGATNSGQPLADTPVVAAGADRLAPSGAVTVLGGSATLAGYAPPAPALPEPTQARETAPSTDYDAIARERLQRYMLDHADEASLNAPQGMMPYARVPAFNRATLDVEE